MEKTMKYYEYMEEINADELYHGLLGFGLFGENIPSFLTSKNFFDFCQRENPNFRQKQFRYIKYESMRNINIPRILAIPNPFAYYKQCKYLKENWENIKQYFKIKTEKNKYKISRIHIRKLKEHKKFGSLINIYHNKDNFEEQIFERKYKNYKIDGSPEQKLFIGKRYKVKADISNCFLSIYTHSIPWALVGKEEAKRHKYDETKWFNKLDKSTTWLNYNETHGILIGPHSSNVISEIILVAIDFRLAEIKRYDYVRNIDDYTCYVSTREEAERFLIDLSQSLRDFNLSLNHKKTEIIELPDSFEEPWVRKLKLFKMETYGDEIKYSGLAPFIDTALELIKQNKNNAAILNYAIKVLISKKFTSNAKLYFIDSIHHLALIYPYLIPLLEVIFDKINIEKEKIEQILDDIFKLGEEQNIFEAMIYGLYFALKFNFKINEKYLKKAREKFCMQDCILSLLLFLYDKNNSKDINKYVNAAKQCIINDNDIKYINDEFWLFAYEVLRIEKKIDIIRELTDWSQLYEKGITFLNLDKFNLNMKNWIQQ